MDAGIGRKLDLPTRGKGSAQLRGNAQATAARRDAKRTGERIEAAAAAKRDASR
jgi:hypothetical protein